MEQQIIKTSSEKLLFNESNAIKKVSIVSKAVKEKVIFKGACDIVVHEFYCANHTFSSKYE